jgi:hypothetical protein
MLSNKHAVNISSELVEDIFSKKTVSNVKEKYPDFFQNDSYLGKLDSGISRNRHKNSLKKIAFAQKKLSILKLIPWIKFAAISGSVAFSSAKNKDDIDIFIVTSAKRVWISRLVVAIILSALGLRRRFNTSDNKNKFCMNYWISEDNLNIKPNIEKANDSEFLDSNLYLNALELVMLKPIYNPYFKKKLLDKNKWIRDFFPDYLAKNESKAADSNECTKSIFSKLVDLFDLFLMKLQIFYMKLRHHSTQETVVKRDLIKFSPKGSWDERIDFINKVDCPDWTDSSSS